jgi:Integral membrane protein S linking to the trans Golgi network
MNSTRPSASSASSGRRNGASSSQQQRSPRNFHPRLIATQIVALQCGHYFLRTLLWEFQSLFLKSDETLIWWSLDRIFASRMTASHWLMELVHQWGAAVGQAVLLLVLVQKSQQCLDFGVTLHALHWLLVALYQQHLPTQVQWYIVQLAALLITVLLGEHWCVQRELDEIPLLTLS